LLISFFFNYLLGTVTFIVILNTLQLVVPRLTWLTLRSCTAVSPSLQFLLTIQLLSLAGLPPTLGFFVKYQSFVLLVQTGYVFLGFFLLFFSLITITYYLRIIQYLWFFPVSVFRVSGFLYPRVVANMPFSNVFQGGISENLAHNFCSLDFALYKFIPEFKVVWVFAFITAIISFCFIFWTDVILLYWTPYILIVLCGNGY